MSRDSGPKEGDNAYHNGLEEFVAQETEMTDLEEQLGKKVMRIGSI